MIGTSSFDDSLGFYKHSQNDEYLYYAGEYGNWLVASKGDLKDVIGGIQSVNQNGSICPEDVPSSDWQYHDNENTNSWQHDDDLHVHCV